MTHFKVLVVETLSASNDYAVSLAAALAEKTNLTFLTVRDSQIPADTPCRLLRAIPLRGRLGFKNALPLFEYILVLTRELWHHRRGIVHIQFFQYKAVEAPIYILARLLFLRRLIFTAHDALPHEPKRWHKLFYKLWYRVVDEIHVLGSYTAEKLQELGIRTEQIHLVPHGNYDLFLFRNTPEPRDSTRKRYGARSNDTVFLMFGLIRPYKGLDLLVQAFCKVPIDCNAYLIVAGGGDQDLFDSAKALLRRGGKDRRASLNFGFVEDAELANLITASDAVVLPYRHIYQSGALLLAMTYGKAIIASDIPGFRDYVTHGEESLLINPENSAELSNAIQALSGDADRRLEMGERARLRACQTYGWSKIADDLVKIYAEPTETN